MASDALYLGLDVGGTKSAAIVGNARGDVLERTEWASEAKRGPEAMIGRLVDEARELMGRHAGVKRAGVSIGGPLDAERGIIYSPPNLPGWDAIELKKILEEKLTLPVQVEHDAAACALAEYHWGTGQGSRRLIYLTCGTGFGAGMVFDGKIYRGFGGRPSDIGHIRYRPEGPISYGKMGSYEAYASGTGLSKLASWRYPQRWGGNEPTGQELAKLAQSGDQDAQNIVRLNAEAVGHCCAMLSDLLYPDVILLGSLARYLGEPWMKLVREAFAAEAYPEAQQVCRIDAAGLGSRLQDCSALVAALST